MRIEENNDIFQREQDLFDEDYPNPLQDLSEENVKKGLMVKAQAKEGYDFEYVEEEYSDQFNAFLKLRSTYLINKTYYMLFMQAKAEKGSDFVMFLYQYKNSIDAYNFLRRLPLEFDYQKDVLRELLLEYSEEYQQIKYGYSDKMKSFDGFLDI